LGVETSVTPKCPLALKRCLKLSVETVCGIVLTWLVMGVTFAFRAGAHDGIDVILLARLVILLRGPGVGLFRQLLLFTIETKLVVTSESRPRPFVAIIITLFMECVETAHGLTIMKRLVWIIFHNTLRYVTYDCTWQAFVTDHAKAVDCFRPELLDVI